MLFRIARNYGADTLIRQSVHFPEHDLLELMAAMHIVDAVVGSQTEEKPNFSNLIIRDNYSNTFCISQKIPLWPF